MLTFSSDCIVVAVASHHKAAGMAGFIRRLGGSYWAGCCCSAGSDAALAIDNDKLVSLTLWAAQHESAITEMGKACRGKVQRVVG